MGSRTFLLSDKLHINLKNFASFLDFHSIRDVDFIKPEFNVLPIDAFGNYAEYRECISSKVAMLTRMNSDELFEYVHDGVSVFDICRVELTYQLITSSPK